MEAAEGNEKAGLAAVALGCVEGCAPNRPMPAGCEAGCVAGG